MILYVNFFLRRAKIHRTVDCHQVGKTNRRRVMVVHPSADVDYTMRKILSKLKKWERQANTQAKEKDCWIVINPSKSGDPATNYFVLSELLRYFSWLFGKEKVTICNFCHAEIDHGKTFSRPKVFVINGEEEVEDQPRVASLYE